MIEIKKHCKTCDTEDVEKFYKQHKYICRECLKVEKEERAREYAKELPLIEERHRLYLIKQQEREEEDYERRMCLICNTPHEECIVPSHPGRASWLQETVSNNYPENTVYSGKWCFYVFDEYIDDLWIVIRSSLAMGKLGNSIKTMREVYNTNKRFIVVIYTFDSTNHIDVYRIGQELINMGITDAFYKTNEATRLGLYNGDMSHKTGGYKPLYKIYHGVILRSAI